MNLENLHRQMKIQKLEDITQECVHSWPKSEKYSEFSKNDRHNSLVRKK